MKRISLFILATLLSLPIFAVATQGQTNKARVNATRAGRKKRIQSASQKGALAAAARVVTAPSGLIYVITRRSNGRQPRQGETVTVHYTGLLANGDKFDSSLDRGQPFSFKLGFGRVIKGWDEGIGKLRVGEQATLIIPPQLGYGVEGRQPRIPGNATLIFIVELVGIEEAPAGN
jgi:peptidylprolyl isomerase